MSWAQRRSFHAVFLTAVAVAMMSVGRMAIRHVRPGGLHAAEIAGLVDASTTLPYRPIEGRVSGGFSYKPFRHRVTRNASFDKADISRWRLFEAADLLQMRAQSGATVSSLHAAGVAHLLVGNSDEGVAALETSLGDPATEADLVRAIRRSKDAELLVDLAAAYQSRVAGGGEPSDLTFALEAAERSWQLAHSPEAGWNRALVIEQLHVTEPALQAWHDFLSVDAGSEYAVEARARLAALNEPGDERLWQQARGSLDDAAQKGDHHAVAQLVRRFPQKSRVLGEELIGVWSTSAGGPAAADSHRALDIARAIGQALVSDYNERLLHDTIARIDNAAAEDRAHFARAHAVYAAAFAAYTRRDFAAAQKAFTDAERALYSCKSPFAVLAAVYLAASAFYNNDVAVCLEVSNAVRVQSLRQRGWNAAAGLADWIYSLPALAAGDIGAALEARLSAREVFVRGGEVENTASVETLLAEVYEFAGDRHRAWLHRLAAMRAAAQDGAYRRIGVLFDEAADAALQQNRIAAALLFQSVVAEHARRRGAPVTVATGHRWRAGALLAGGDINAARDEIAAGRRALATIDDAAIRERASADLDLCEAQALFDVEPGSAIRLAARAIGFFSRSGRTARVAEASLVQARAYVRLGDTTAGLALLRDTVPRIETQRSTIEDVRLRLTYLGLRSAAYRELASSLIDRRAHADAFAVVEQARGRAILDAVARRTPDAVPDTPATLAEIQKALPAGHVLVFYADLSDSIGAWVVSAKTVAFKRLSVTRASLPRPGRNRSGRHPLTRTAYDTISHELIEPLWDRLDRSLAVVFITEAPLDCIPFAALRAPSGRQLIEHFAVGVAPSATMWIELSARQCAGTGRPRVLVVSQVFGETRRLPEGKSEAEFVASLYADAHSIDSDSVTAAAVAQEAMAADLIHLVAHGAASDQPFASGIQALQGGGLWTADDVLNLHLKTCATVVLSGCATATGAAVGSESPTSLANAFLASGARNVVATLWDVDDSEAAEFMRTFHAFLARGQSVNEAFRNARLTRVGAHDDTWAAFQLMGAV